MDWRDASIGGQVNPGWEPLVDELHAKVLEIDPNVHVAQVKEKFGGLRYYFDTDLLEGYDKIAAIVDEYEARSYKTCEVCGSTEAVETGGFGHGWVNSLCPVHRKIREEEGTSAWRIAANEKDRRSRQFDAFTGTFETPRDEDRKDA